MPYKKHTTLFTSCPHFTWPHYVLGKALTIAASKWMCSQAKAPMSSASLHHRFHPLHLLKIGQGNPSRAYLRGNKKLAEKTGGVLSIKPSLIGFALHVMIGFSCRCCWNMVRDVGAVTWGIEACVAFVMRIFVKQIGVLGLSGGRSGYTRNHISFIQSLQKAHFFFFLFFCFLGFW
ncbi:uncharacterized protein LOC133674043 [Populus nigra]|uniref:uncharacterized protein LOC133674043 n=1 Tax=Populus nigra TaxID=3691 RepID=UPI002B27ABE7|nr:uncharacterized protein LOC133674043 [Populus nigra]